MENKDLVLKTMREAAGPMKSGDLAEKTGIDKKEVDKVIKALVKEDVVYSPKRCFYAPK